MKRLRSGCTILAIVRQTAIAHPGIDVIVDGETRRRLFDARNLVEIVNDIGRFLGRRVWCAHVEHAVDLAVKRTEKLERPGVLLYDCRVAEISSGDLIAMSAMTPGAVLIV